MEIRRFSLLPPKAAFPHALPANAYLLEEGEVRWFIDAGYAPSQIDFLVRKIFDVPAGSEIFRGLVLTHCHPAHAGGAPGLVLHGVPVFASSREAPHSYTSSKEHFGMLGIFSIDSSTEAAFLSRISRGIDYLPEKKIGVEEGESLLGMGEAMVLSLPGHTWDSLGIYLPEQRALFSGDLLLEGREVPVVSLGDVFFAFSPGENTLLSSNLLMALRSTLHKVASLDDFVLYPGHGDPIDEGKEFARLASRRLESRLSLVRERIDRPYTVAEVAYELFPRAVRKDLLRVALEVALYLDVLVQEGFLRLVWESCASGVPCARVLPVRNRCYTSL